MKTFWMKSPVPGNMGHVLTRELFPRLGLPVEWAPSDEADLLGCGSILGRTRPSSKVFGSGAATADVYPDPGARYYAVRGPLSADLVRSAGGNSPIALGDPALLLPDVHARPIEKRWDLGVVLHYVDRRSFGYVHQIDPLHPDPLVVVDRIRECRRIASSSLHGLVVAQAYGIPFAWLDYDSVLGDGTKFRDFGLSVGLELRPETHPDTADYVLGEYDPDPLRGAFRALRENA